MVNREIYPVQLVAVDIDGCLSPGLFKPFDLGKLQQLADYNNRSRKEPEYPPITICTGRPEPYAEALLQIVRSYYPAVCEHGGMLCGIEPPLMLFNPELPEDVPGKLVILKQKLFAIERDGCEFFLEPGKETHGTVFIKNSMPVEELQKILEGILKETNLPFILGPSRGCVNVFPKMLHKGMGIEWLSKVIKIPTENFAGIGDSNNDAPFLERVGFPATVSNGTDKIKQIPRIYISDKPNVEGVLDIYHHCVELNKSRKVVER